MIEVKPGLYPFTHIQKAANRLSSQYQGNSQILSYKYDTRSNCCT